MNPVRAAMTETCNAYQDMPASVADLPAVAGQLDDIRQANLSHHVELIGAAAAQGVRIIGLGELFAAPYFALHRHEFWRDMAESAADGPTVTMLRDVAREHAMVIVAPIYELAGESRFNTAVVLDSDGQILGKHRKCHIPRGVNEEHGFDEKFYYSPSDGNPYLAVFESAVGRVGIAICYDRHFEGMMSGLAALKAQIIFSPAITFGSRSRRMWDLEFEVDAARHNVFIAGSNRRGSEPPWNQAFFGNSYFVSPAGRLQNLSTHPNLVIADLELDELDLPDGSGWNLRGDARPDIY